MLADAEIDISRVGLGDERELEAASTAWLTGGDSVATNLDLDNRSSMQAWDQFAANERLAGIRTSYSDELYTTKLSDKHFTKEQLEKAERLAREIESKVTTNAHVLEERGLAEQQEDGDR